MPYSIEHIEKEGGLITTWEGSVTGDELIRSYYDRFSSVEREMQIPGADDSPKLIEFVITN